MSCEGEIKSGLISGKNTEEFIGFFDIVNKRYLSMGGQVSNSILFDIASSNRYSAGLSSPALLALRRWFKRSLRQMGAGLLSLMLVWGAIAHDQSSLDSASSASIDLHSGQPATVQGVLTEGDKPFQALRPKMTYHRLTTSRLSIPAADNQALASLPNRELGRETK